MAQRAGNGQELGGGETLNRAREAVGEKATAARDAMGERASAAREAAGDAIAAIKPRLRGRSHEWAFFTSLGLGAALIAAADTPRSTLAMAIYAVSVSALFGTSALYHRIDWKRPRARQWMRRLDHSMIFFLIAGTYTPFALLVLDGAIADGILIAVWTGALAGSIVEILWTSHPKWVSALIYLAVGWIAVVSFPAMLDAVGVGGMALIVGGGILYSAGALVYAIQRPNPNPAVFGYHEIFHLLVIAAAAVHFTAVAIYALPAG
jgi:hemolysin III